MHAQDSQASDGQPRRTPTPRAAVIHVLTTDAVFAVSVAEIGLGFA